MVSHSLGQEIEPASHSEPHSSMCQATLQSDRRGAFHADPGVPRLAGTLGFTRRESGSSSLWREMTQESEDMNLDRGIAI